MTKVLDTKRLELGLATLAAESTAAAGAAAAGSLWVRQGNGTSTPTQLALNLDGAAGGWCIQNLVNLKVYNVKTFGAVGNGVTDDMAAINAAINAALVGAVGGVIYFPPGTYKVTRPVSGVGSIVLSHAADLVFLGDGAASTISMIGSAAFGDWYMFRIRNGSTRLKFIGLNFQSNITDKDPAEQNHFLNISGVAGDPFGGPTDIDISHNYFGFIVGDCVRHLGEAGQVVANIRTMYNMFDMTASRSAAEAQRYTQYINISWNFMTGSQDQQIDFEPTAGNGPLDWTIVGNMCDASSSTSSAAITISGAGNAGLSNNRRMLLAFNTITHGGSIAGVKGLTNCDIIGNIVTADTTSASDSSAPLDISQQAIGNTLMANVLINQSTVNNRLGIRLSGATSLSAPAQRNEITDNIVTATGTDLQGIGVNESTDVVISGNLVYVDTSVATKSSGISAVAVSTPSDHILIVGNLILGITQPMRQGVNFSASGEDVHNVAAIYNHVSSSAFLVVFARNATELFLDWRYIGGNNCGGETVDAISGIGTNVGATMEGCAGPGTQIAWIGVAAGPEGNVSAGQGSMCLNTAGGDGSTLFYKESGGTASSGWASEGPALLTMGAQASGIATAARFFAPGAGLAAVGTVEIQFAVPRAGTIRNMRLSCAAGTGAANVTYTLRKNGVDTAVTLTISNTASSGSDLTHSFTVAAGDLISLSIVRDVAPAAGQSQVVGTFELA